MLASPLAKSVCRYRQTVVERRPPSTYR